VFFDTRDRTIDLGEESSRRKLLIGAVVAIGSFSTSSPHFFLNLLTIFSCSISLVRFISFTVCLCVCGILHVVHCSHLRPMYNRG
jgi:hypothetical protein